MLVFDDKSFAFDGGGKPGIWAFGHYQRSEKFTSRLILEDIDVEPDTRREWMLEKFKMPAPL